MPRTMMLPKIGVNMTEAIVDEWFVKPGDLINEGDAILLAETDKATQDIYAAESGIVGELLVEKGDKVMIHDPIMVLLDAGEFLPESVEPVKVAKDQKPAAKIESGAVKAVVRAEPDSARVRISPLAKKIAREMGIEPRDLKPEKTGGRIVKKDVLGHTSTAPKLVASEQDDILEIIPLSGIRKVISTRMLASSLEQPSAALTISVDAGGMMALRETFKQGGKRISYNEIIVKCCAKALKQHPMLNARMGKEGIELLRGIHIGVAVDSEKGLVVPVIRDADKKNLAELSDDFAAKVQDIGENKLSAKELSGSTFTITNLGMLGIESFTALINPPECAILAVGAIKRVYVPDDDGQPAVRQEMKMTLSFDHRVVDGWPAAKFLRDVKTYIEKPVMML